MCVKTNPNSAKPSGEQFASQVPANDSPKCNSASQRLHLCWVCVNPKLLKWRLTCSNKRRPTFRRVNEAILTKAKPRNPHPYPSAHPTNSRWLEAAASTRTWPLLRLLTIPFSWIVEDSKISTEVKQLVTGDILKKKNLIYSLILVPITRDYPSLDYGCASLLWEKH